MKHIKNAYLRLKMSLNMNIYLDCGQHNQQQEHCCFDHIHELRRNDEWHHPKESQSGDVSTLTAHLWPCACVTHLNLSTLVLEHQQLAGLPRHTADTPLV